MLEEARTPTADSRVPLDLASVNGGILIVRGYADIFARTYENGSPGGRRRHIARIEASSAMFGARLTRQPSGNLELIAVAGSDSEYGAIDTADADLRVRLLESWASAVIDRYLPRVNAGDALALDAATTPSLEAGSFAGGNANPLWLIIQSGSCVLAEAEVVGSSEQPRMVFLPPHRGVGFPTATTVEVLDTASLLARFDPDLVASEVLELTQRLALADVLTEQQAFAQRRADREILDEEELGRAFAHLAVIGGKESEAIDATDSAPLVAACRLVMQRAGIAVPEHIAMAGTERNAVSRIARAARARMRRVALTSGWHRKDNGPLLAFDLDTSRPLALLPRGAKAYIVVDPADGSTRRVDDATAATIAPFGYCFYRPFPNVAMTVRGLLRFALRDIARDWIAVLAVGAAIGILGLATPVFTQMVFDSVIPNGERDILFQVVIGLFAASLGAALFGMTQNIAMVRMATRMHASIDLAMWDRLMDQPATFYRRFTVGDLAQRASSINEIRRLMSTTALSTILASVFSLFNLALLFYYSPLLSLTAAGLLFVALVLIVGSAWTSTIFLHRVQEQQGRILSLLNQLLSGIAKLRTAAAEIRAFRRWADIFSRARRTIWQADIVSAGFETTNAFFTVASTMVIFTVVGFSITRDSGFSVGDFIAFNVAYGILSASVLALGTTLLQLVNVVPLYRRARPILESVPETAAAKNDPGELAGAVSASGLTFRYDPDGPPILSDVSLSVKAGEFVAIVGPSGSGKSTLLRLLLGLETPESGSIYFDGQDLAELDLREVRQQIGVVLQTSRVLPGSIMENIVGTSGLSEDEAWEAARMAGLDEDIRQLPMGMLTLVMEGGGGLSGGQQQRLQIARAIARKPRLLFLDEATSALDNRTQALVTGFLKTLRATRIVIAHRLSTIRDADRIIVMRDGAVVEEGSFDELMAKNGTFVELAGRQLQ